MKFSIDEDEHLADMNLILVFSRVDVDDDNDDDGDDSD